MSVCRVRESQEVVSSIRQIRRWHDGPELDAKGWELAIAEDLEIDPDTFSLALQMTGENNEVRHLLNSYGIDTASLLEESSGLIVPKTNTVELINSHDIDDMFHGIPAAAKYFEGRSNRQVATEAWLNRGEASNYVENNETVSKNMQYLKNDLFKNIQNFLIEKGELPGVTTAKALFDDFRLVDFAYYNRVMETAANHFFKGDYAMLNSYTNKKIPNISKDNTLGNKVYEAYSDLIFLANFDTVIKNNFGHMIKINGRFLDTIEGSPTHDKYSVKADAVSTMFWSNDTHASDGAQSLNTKMASMLINVVPAFDKEGNKLPIFMEMNDMYLFSAVIADFELEHGNRMLADTGNGFDYLSKDTSKQFEWYLNTIMDSFLSEDSTNANKEIIKKHFEPYSNIIYSLHAFINDTDLNIPMKEQTADITIKELFGQVLGNSYGAIYHIYNSSGDLTVQQVYSQDFNSTGLQNTIFSKLRSVSHNDTYYSMKDARNIAEFNALFEGVDGKVSMLENIYNNVNFYEGINSYIHDNTGLKIDREILLKTAEDLQKNVGGRVITTNEFRTALSNLMHSISQDFTNNIITRETESIEQREARFDSNIGKLIPATINERLYKAMSKTILARFPIKSVSNITTLTGETIPAYKLANLTYKDTDLFDSQRNYEKKEGNIYKSLFLTEDRVILGTTTKLEIINDTGYTKTNKSAGKMIAMESLMSDFNYGFLESISAEENPTFNVMIGNYSDKGTILSKLIDGNWTIKGKLVREMTGEEISEHVRIQGYRFYRDALFNVFNDYNTIFDLAGVPHTTLEVSEDMDGPETDQSINELNRILNEYDIKDIIHRADRPDIKIIEELHYSKYGDTYAVNQVLADNYRIFSDETRFKQFSNILENNVIDKYNGIKGSVTENDSPLTRITSKHLEALNLADSEFDFTEFRSKEGEFNPVVKKWLWMNALARNEYLYMSTKGEYMHPQKKAKLRHSNVPTTKIAPVIAPKVQKLGNVTINEGVARVTSEAEAKEAIDQIIYESQFIKTTADEKHYEDIRNRKYYEHLPDGAEKTAIRNSYLYDRVSNFTKTSNISDTNLNVKTATTLGTKFDNFARDFFSDSVKPLQEYELASNEAFRGVLQGLYELKQKMEANGETIIANDVTLHNKELMLAGTVDLITYDKQGRIRIYDFKTMRGDNFTERYNAYNRETDGLTKYDTRDFGQSKREQHTNQTSLYSIMANNTYGLESAELVIIPVALDYDVKVYKDYPVGTPMSQIEADIKNVRTKSLKLLPLVNIVPETTIVGEIREGQQTKVATLKNLNASESLSKRRFAEQNSDKVFLFGQNGVDSEGDLSGLPNAVGIDLKPKPKKSLKKANKRVKKVVKYSRAAVKADTNSVYLFGDNTDDRLNTKYVPTSTQAVIRGLPNAIGIDTKKNRGTSEGSSVNEVTIEKASKKTKINASERGYELNIKGISGVRAYITNENSKEWVAYSVTNSGKVYQMGSGKTMKSTIQKIQDNFNSALKDPEIRGKLLATLEINSESSYFTDSDFDQFKTQVDEAIQQAINSGKTIVIPKEGIGTGEAELKQRAPKLFAYLQGELKKLESLKPINQTETEESSAQEFLTDEDFSIFKDRVDAALKNAVAMGKTIVLQTDANGEIELGQIELENAPKLKAYLDEQLNLLQEGKILPKKKLDAAANFSMDYWQEYLEEVAERMVVMSKRNVTNTATFEVAVRNSILGTSPTVNIAAMEDFVTGIYSVTGQKQYAMSTDENGNTVKKEFQDAHDGSSFLNYVYSRMVDASYPGKGYEGTKKRFGTLVTDHGVVVKKDSESVITNEKIRNSEKSPIQLRSMQQRMLALDINDLNITYNKKFLGEQFFKRLGKFYQITEIDLSKNAEGQHILDLELSVEGVDGSWTSQRISSQVNTLYDIWNSIGGEFSTNSEGGWTEGSNDMLYDLVVHSENTDLNGDTKKGLLKDKMIHIVSNQTALKAGATNINKSDAWTTNKRLLYATFESKFMGPQLDASHDMDNSEIHEITQIISALAQGGHTSEMAREAYEDIRNVIVETSQTYVKHLDGLNNVDISQEDRKTKLLDYLSHRFMDSLGNTKGNDIAKTLVHNLKSDGVNIPFSNQNFYSAFVKDVISRMNVDFISRKYPGIGAVLAASQGIIQVYDIDITNEDGTTTTVQATQGDIAKIALDTYNEQDFISRHGKAAESNHEIIDDYIFMNMQDKDVTLGEIEIGDIIRVGDKEISLTNPEEYYKFKADFSGNNTSTLTGETSLVTMENMLFKKVMNRPRDLKPTLHSFTHNGSRRNVFDFQSIKFRYYLENINNPSVVQSMGSENRVIMSNLINYINRKYGAKDNYVSLESLANNKRMSKFVRSFLNNWTQRNFSLLEHNLTTPVVDRNTDFESYFQNDDVMVDVLEDVIDNYRASTVSDVQFKEAELILGDMYKNNFDRTDHETMYEIFRQKEQFFADKILKDYVKDDTDADLKIVSTRSDTPVYIKYVEELPYTDDSVKLTKDRGDGVNENMNNYVRRGLENEVLYRVPDMRNVVVKRENNSDVIYVKWSKYATKDGHIINKDFYKVMNTLLKSFGNDLKTIVPLMRDNSEYNIVEKGELSSIDLNEVTLDMFQKYTGIKYELDLTKGSIFESAEDLADILAKKKYASWLKSHEVVAARIPAQSMQSFMPMRNIAYNVGSKNDAFVSISQIWLQGSDFDIDKAYILGYSFNKKGNYNSWSNLTNYSTKGQLDALNKLPKANNSILQIAENTTEIDATLSNYYSEILTMLPVTYNSLEPEVINVFNKMIRYINKNEITHLAIDPNLDQGDFPISLVVEYINRHNKQIEGKEGESSLLNKIVSKIQDVISAPSNQMHANSPITIQDWHDVVDSVKKRKESTPETKMIMTEVVKDNTDIFQTRDIIGISKMLTENHMGSEFFYDAKKKEVGVLENGMTIEEYKAIRKSDNWKSVPGYTVEYLNERYRDFVEFKNVTQTPASPYDMISYYVLQQNAAVGKEDVGIAANGVKSFFALSDYFNTFYKGVANEMSIKKLRTSHEMFQKSFDFILPGGRDIKFRSNTIADIQMNRNMTQKLREGVRENYKANYSNAALILSGLLSAATDNAKELLMAEINATPQLFSMHLYLAVLGLDMEQIVELMTSDIAEDVIKLSDHNTFIRNRAMGMNKIFTTLEGWYAGNDIKTNNLAVFKNIYHSSKEFSALAGLLGINQKRKANPWEIYDYLAKLENVFETTNDLVIKQNTTEEGYKAFKNLEVDEKWIEAVVTKINAQNPMLSEKDGNYIKAIVTEASNIAVKYTDFNGQEAEKNVNIIKEGIDFRLYLNDENYKRIVKDYYNLIKHTFNVFDIMDNVPHFKGMVDSLVLTHDMLLNSSEKYNFVYGKVKDVFNMGNTLNSTWHRRYIDQYAVGKSSSMFDMMVAEKWMKDKAGHINLNIQKLMELAGVDEYNVYINDRIKDQAIANVDDATVRQIKAKDGSNPIITLDSTYNIAMFKKVMEDLILPILQKKLDTEFLDSLKLESVITPFGLNGSAIVSMHSLQELNTHTSLEQFEKLLNSFDSLDSEDELKGLIKNNVGAELKIRDLFFLYNLIVHQEKYGNKKLTPILINYMKEKNSLGYEYMKYYAEVDKGSIDLYEDLKIKYGEKWKEQLENNIFFHISNSRGMASITRDGEVNTVSITNPHITMMSNVDYTKKLNQKYTDINKLARLIREKGWAVTLEC